MKMIMPVKRFCFLMLVVLGSSVVSVTHAQSSLKIAKLKYGGGGDWYANKTSLPNLIRFCNAELKMNINPSSTTANTSAVSFVGTTTTTPLG